MNNIYVRILSVFVTFMIFLGALMLMRKYNVSMPIKIIILFVMIIIIDYTKNRIFRVK